MAIRPIELVVMLMLATLPAPAAFALPDTVFFPSADGSTEIVAYLFKPETPGPHPAIVMLHGRGGPYSSNINEGCTLVSRASRSACNASGLSKRHLMWGQYWAEHGYVALLPDSFGPRGKAHGFGRFTHDEPDRADVNEKTVRPLDAEGALSWLRSQRDVVPHRIFLQGWSNGGSTALNVMQRQGAKTSGYRAALALYPGCGTESPACARSRDDCAGRLVARLRRRRGLACEVPGAWPSDPSPRAARSMSCSIPARHMVLTTPDEATNPFQAIALRSRMH
jgi:carboxymethylenebutenolidase